MATGSTLKMIDNRGVKVWPDGMPETFCTESFRCRFLKATVSRHEQTLALLGRVLDHGHRDRQNRIPAQLRRQARLHAGQGQ